MGPVRLRAAHVEISARPPHQQFSALEAANVQRDGAGDPGIRRGMADLASQAPRAQARLMACSRNFGNHSRNPVWDGGPRNVLSKLRSGWLASVGLISGG